MSRITVFKLYGLIGALKKEEKRSFKLYTKRYNLNGDSVYLKVFDYLDKMKRFDAEKFRKKFEGVKGISGIQTYLYQQILKSLRSQQAYRNTDLILMEGLADLEILFRKNLLDATKEKLSELQKIAEEHHKILFLPLIYEWWFKLENTRLKYEDVNEETFGTYQDKYSNIFLVLKEYASYRMQLGEVLFSIKGKYSRQFFDNVNELTKNLPAYVPNQIKSIPGEIAALQLRAFLAAVNRNRVEAERYHGYLYHFTKELPSIVQKDYKRTHYQALGSLIVNSSDVNAVKPLLKTFNEIKKEDQKYLSRSMRLAIISTQIQLYLATGAFDECTNYINGLQLEDYPNNTIYCILQYQLALSRYANKNYNEALQILDAFLFSKRSHERSNSYGILLKIVILYERREYLMLASLMNNTRRNFKRKGTLFEFEKILISLMNKLVKLPRTEHKDELIAFRAKLNDFLSPLPVHEKEFLLYFNYLGWLDSLIHKQKFTQLCYWNLESIEE